MAKIPWEQNLFNPVGALSRKLEGLNLIRVDDNYLNMAVQERVFDQPVATHFQEFVDRLFRGTSGTPGKGGTPDNELSRMVLTSLFEDTTPQQFGAVSLSKAVKEELGLPKSAAGMGATELANTLKKIISHISKNGEKYDRGHTVSISYAILFTMAAKRRPFPFGEIISAGQTGVGAFLQSQRINQEFGRTVDVENLASLKNAIRVGNSDSIASGELLALSQQSFWGIVLPTSNPDKLQVDLRSNAISQMKRDTGLLQEKTKVSLERANINVPGSVTFTIPEERKMLDPDKYFEDNRSTLAEMTIKSLQAWKTTYLDANFIKDSFLEKLLGVRARFYPALGKA